MMPRMQRNIPLLVICLLFIALSTWFRSAMVWDDGLRISPDSMTYLSNSNTFAQNGTFAYRLYDPEAGAIVAEPLTHYPPLAPIIYSLPLLAGVDLATAPTIISLMFWALFLAGMGLFTYRLSASPTMAAFSVALAAITYPFLYVFSWVWSEPIFLPLLVFAVLIFTDLPRKEQGVGLYLAAGTALLAALMMTRYVGLFLYAATVAWWIGWRITQRQSTRLFYELPILGLGALPLLGWLIRNVQLSGGLFGSGHLSTSTHTFLDGLEGVANQRFWLVSPIIPLHYIRAAIADLLPGIYVNWLVTLLMIGAGVALVVWRKTALKPDATLWDLLLGSPILPLVFTYLALYTLVQPLARFHPMDTRDATTVLCLLQPWLLALVARLSTGWRLAFLASYGGFNTLILLAYLLYPPVQQQLATFDPSAPPETRAYQLDWLFHPPPHTHDLTNHHPDVVAWLQGQSAPPGIVSNGEYLFAPYPALGTPGRPKRSLGQWLAAGTCTPEYPLVIVLFDWNRWDPDEWTEDLIPPEETQAPARLVEEKCPGMNRQILEHSLVYTPHASP